MPSSSLFLVLRRMRAPLIALILIYAVSITGLVLIPGADSAGRPARMDFLHAFYFVSYTATTIGFGELPTAFTPGQRLWVTFCIYLTVVGWGYTFVKLLALFQDRWFLQAIREQQFKRQVRGLSERFYLVCGYGDTGSLLCRALDALGSRLVILDRDEHRIAEIDLAGYRADTPALAADVRLPDNLVAGGLRHPLCAGVLALTDDERANLAVASAVRLLRPDLTLICRAETPAVAAEMRLFNVEDVVDPFEKFAEYLHLAIESPGSYQLLQWLTGLPGTTLGQQTEPPHGRWVVCGSGHFAAAVSRKLRESGIEVGVARHSGQDPPDPSEPSPAGECDLTDSLRQAELERTVGLIAGTEDDTGNLSIVMAARRLQPGLFFAIRQNLHANRMLFEAFDADMMVVSREIIVHECLARIATPLLSRFLAIAKNEDDAWADAVLEKLRCKLTRRVPVLWTVELSARDAPAWADAFRRSAAELRLDHLLREPGNRELYLACVPLLIVRAGEETVLPGPEFTLQQNDRILFAGTADARDRQSLALLNIKALQHIHLGSAVSEGWLWGKLKSG